ncbi:MAG: hypothetical protein H0V18_01655 [Pyrinomonadaceae bacterium]|nr:hypothetical protein [Pyrinomonadaceae bacterium]
MKSRFLAVAFIPLLLLPLAGQAGSPKVGAYQPAELEKPEVKAAAEFAVQEQSKQEKTPIALQTMVKAHEQVVAGMNYRLTLSVIKDSKPQSADAVVFRGLDSHYELKSWQWMKP